MTPTLSTRLVPNDRIVHLLAVGGAYTTCSLLLLAFSFLWDGDHVGPLEPVSGTVALVLTLVAMGHLKDAVRPAFQFWRVHRALANPRFGGLFATQVRNAAIDHLHGLDADIDRLQGKRVVVETEWICRSSDLYPVLARVLVEDGGSHTSRQRFLDNPGNHQLSWETLGVRGNGLKPFALHTTFGPLPVGTAHARLERACLRNT